MNVLDRLAALITGTKEYELQQKILAINMVVWGIYLVEGLYAVGV